MRGNSPEGLLNIPEQSKPTTGSFDTRSRQVEAWVSALPMANTGESARRIFNALQEMNRLAIPANDRFKALEHFRAPVFYISEVLKKHYVSQNLPLSPKNQKIAELAIQLQSEMALGYKCVIEDKLASTFSKLSGKTLTINIHRAIEYLSNVLLCAYQIYIQHPENTWLQIHRLYHYAEINDLHNTPVRINIPNEPEAESTISDVYKKILLLALAGPYRLRQQVTEAVSRALVSWTNECKVLPFSEVNESGFGFVINLNTDAAPGYFRDDGTANPTFHRVVDTSDLVVKLGEEPLVAGGDAITIPENVQRRLAHTWSGKLFRAFSRTTKSNETAITLGLSATHHYIDEVVRPLLKDAALPCPTATESFHADKASEEDSGDAVLDDSANFTSTPIFGISNLDDHTPDVWDPDFTYRASNPSYSLNILDEEDAEKKAELYAPLACQGINESAAGYCLLGNLAYAKDSQKVQVGELVGIRDSMDSDSTQLGIGVIRRIKSWNNGLELGIQKLAPCADAIATATLSDEHRPDKYQRSLVLPALPGINQPATLITHAWHRIGDHLITNVHGQYTRVKLIRQLENTGVFNQFEFKVMQDSDDKSPMQDEIVLSDDEFESVWKLI